MIYPEFIKKGDKLGIVALSAGVGKKLDEYIESIDVLKDQGYEIKEAASVRINDERSNTALVRAQELDELVEDDEIKMILCAAGGDSQLETVPYIDYESIRKNPKWLMGFSDPTNLLFPVTTMLDIATIYGFNGGSFNSKNLLEQQNCLEIIKGNLVKQYSYDKYIDFLDLKNEINNFKDVSWKSKEDINIKGRCIGGCLDCIVKLVGTEVDYVNGFIEKYKDDGIVWYLDNFALNAYDTYLSLLQLKAAGYFRYCKGILIGRVAIPNEDNSTLIKSYEEAYEIALEGIPYIYDTDIGHSYPHMTMINGALINVEYKDHKGSIEFELETIEKGENKMVLINCPECGREVSDQASECIHCGYPLKVNIEESVTTNLVDISSEQVIEAYDVMLVDYGDLKFTTANNLRKFLGITYKEAYSLLATLPSYIYNDIPQADAEYIARKLMNMNMRIAVYDPVGNVRYYEPPRYLNRPLPVVAPMPRVKRIVKPNPIIHHMPYPAASPFNIYTYNDGPKKNPSKPYKTPTHSSAKKGPTPSSPKTIKNPINPSKSKTITRVVKNEAPAPKRSAGKVASPTKVSSRSNRPKR